MTAHVAQSYTRTTSLWCPVSVLYVNLRVCLFRYRIQAAHPQGSRLLRGSQVHTSFGEPLYYSRIQRLPQLLCQRHTKGVWEKHIRHGRLSAKCSLDNNQWEINSLLCALFSFPQMFSVLSVTARCYTFSHLISPKWPGTKTRWTSQMKPSTGCSANRAFWRSRSVNPVRSMEAFTCAKQSTIAGRTWWSASWRFAVSILLGVTGTLIISKHIIGWSLTMSLTYSSNSSRGKERWEEERDSSRCWLKRRWISRRRLLHGDCVVPS